MLNEIISPISVAYCKKQVREYCKDSSEYMQELMVWKDSNNNNNCCIIAADVKSLYPSLNRDLVKTAMNDALSDISDYSEIGIDTMVQLVMHYLKNVVIEF